MGVVMKLAGAAGCPHRFYHLPHQLYKGSSLPIRNFSLPHTESLMDLTLLLLLFAVILDLHPAEARAFEKRNSSDLLVACNMIAQAISNASQVFYPCEHLILLFVMPRSDEY